MKLADMLTGMPNHAPNGRLSALVFRVGYGSRPDFYLSASSMARILHLIAENGVPEDLQDIINEQDREQE